MFVDFFADAAKLKKRIQTKCLFLEMLGVRFCSIFNIFLKFVLCCCLDGFFFPDFGGVWLAKEFPVGVDFRRFCRFSMKLRFKNG